MTPATNRQVPDNAILDYFNKQVYLGNKFVVSTGSVSLSGTSEVPFIYLSNPALSGLAQQNGVGIFCDIQKLYCTDISGATGVTFRIYKNPTTVATGTALTPRNQRIASAAASIATVKKSPTAVSNGTLLATFVSGWQSQTLSDILFIADPGNSLLITAQPTADTTAIGTVSWYEI